MHSRTDQFEIRGVCWGVGHAHRVGCPFHRPAGTGGCDDNRGYRRLLVCFAMFVVRLDIMPFLDRAIAFEGWLAHVLALVVVCPICIKLTHKAGPAHTGHLSKAATRLDGRRKSATRPTLMARNPFAFWFGSTRVACVVFRRSRHHRPGSHHRLHRRLRCVCLSPGPVHDKCAQAHGGPFNVLGFECAQVRRVGEGLVLLEGCTRRARRLPAYELACAHFVRF